MIKKLTPFIVLGALTLFGCSGSGPSPSDPEPPAPATWSIAEFSVSNPSPYVETVIQVTIRVEKDGAAAPDGTNVELSVGPSDDLPGGATWGFGNGQTTAKLATEDGTATITFYSDTAATFVFSAQVRTASRSISAQYRNRDITDALQIYGVTPRIGSFDGGEQVILTGKGIAPPVEVSFTVLGTTYPAVVEQVDESIPLSAEGTIFIRTPYISNLTDAQREQDQAAQISVTGEAGTQSPQTVVLPAAFTFLAQEGPPDPEASLLPPNLYAVSPDNGNSQGGDVVTILGRNFRAIVTDGQGTVVETPVALTSVQINGLEAQIQSVSADGTQATVVTPQFIVGPLEDDTLVNVRITTQYTADDGTVFGPFTVELTNGFLIRSDRPQPEITGLSPIAGPVDGGTRVTIFGHGFQAPAQVTFGDLAAVDVELNDDQSLNDNDTIICTTPDYSQQGQGQVLPIAVEVVVRNTQSGKASDPATFTYGDNLFISGNSPQEGGPGSLVLIYGSGFEDPLEVEYLPLGIDMDIISVSGTELAVRFPLDEPVQCNSARGQFLVRLADSNTFVQGGDFEFLGNTPLVYSVDPVFVQEVGPGTGVTPTQITIEGEFFLPDLIVEIDDFRMQNVDVDVVDTTQIDVYNIPSPNDLDLAWDTQTCITGGGLTGTRRAPTPVDVTVINLPGECSTTLPGALVYEPEDTTCEVSPAIQLVAPAFPATAAPAGAGACGEGILTISNVGSGTLEIQNISLLGRFFFGNGPGNPQVEGGPVNVAPFGSIDRFVYFCPDVDNGEVYSGQVTVVSNDPGSPTSAGLSAQEAFPVLSGTATLDFGNQAIGGPYGELYTLTNTGSASLDWSAAVGGDPEFALVGPSNGTLAPGASVDIQVDFSPGAAEPYTGTLTITGAQADAQGSPLAVSLTGTGT